MSKFDTIIGYTEIKKELVQIADTLKNREAYEKLGASSPRGLLLHGEPGVGKSLMASAIIEESGRKTFVCRKDLPNVDFIKVIKATFEKAIENAPSIVLLDDMDKFANGDEKHPNAEEYVTVQSCIDEAKGKEVFVLATVNDIENMPKSLCRAGRFDRIIEISVPRGRDALAIICHYLKNKKIVGDVDVETIARIVEGHSCAQLETIINEAGLIAGFERAESISMRHFMDALLRTVFGVRGEGEYDGCDDFARSGDEFALKIAYHEAGHVVISETLCPDSVTLVSVNNDRSGFTHYYKDDCWDHLHWLRCRIVGALAGIAATEYKCGKFDGGSNRDIVLAFSLAKELVEDHCTSGFAFFQSGYHLSEGLRSKKEAVVTAEIEKHYKKAKEIIATNHEFLDKIAAALLEKKILSALDIQKIKSECKITAVTL